MFVLVEIVVRNNLKKLSSLNKLNVILKYLKIFTRMQVNELFGFRMVSSNYYKP